MIKYIFIACLVLTGCFFSVRAQETGFDNQPLNARKNAGLLFAGIALQGLGIGIVGGSIYLDIEVPDNGVTSITYPFGLTLVAGGTYIIAKSVHTMVRARKARHEWRQNKKTEKISLKIEPTRYGYGLVCRF